MAIKNDGNSGFRATPNQMDASQAETETAGKTEGADPTSESAQLAADLFDNKPTGLQTKQLEKLLSESSGQPSLLENLNHILLNKQDQLLEEYSGLNESAQALAAEFAESGFSSASLEKRRPDLLLLRKEMAGLRKRLNSIHRRLRISSSKLASAPESNLSQRLGTQFQSIRRIDPGVDRALAFLELAAHIHQHSANPDHQNAIRASIPPNIDRTKLGGYLAETAPSAQLAQAAAALIAAGPEQMQGNVPLSAEGSEVHQELLGDKTQSSSLKGLADYHEVQNSNPTNPEAE
jgi:hypothetical protein